MLQHFAWEADPTSMRGTQTHRGTRRHYDSGQEVYDEDKTTFLPLSCTKCVQFHSHGVMHPAKRQTPRTEPQMRMHAQVCSPKCATQHALGQLAKHTHFLWCDKSIHRPPGFAFIDFEDPRDADDAVRKLDGEFHLSIFVASVTTCLKGIMHKDSLLLHVLRKG